METVELLSDQKVTLTIDPKNKAAGTAVALTGRLASVTVDTGGATYVGVPVIGFVVDPPPKTPAIGVATVAGGAITGISVVGNLGAGYKQRPAVVITPASGDNITTPAVATAVMETAAVAPEWTINGPGTLVPAVGGLTCDVVAPDEGVLSPNVYPGAIVSCRVPATLAAGEANTDLIHSWRIVYKGQHEELLTPTTGSPAAKT